jgi:hypothetical protein
VEAARLGHPHVLLEPPGKLHFEPARAASFFSGLRKVRPALSEAEMFKLRRDRSNGYVQIKSATAG